jgi:hypothetical protein
MIHHLKQKQIQTNYQTVNFQKIIQSKPGLSYFSVVFQAIFVKVKPFFYFLGKNFGFPFTDNPFRELVSYRLLEQNW